MAVNVRWKWLDNSGWKLYDAATSARLEQLFAAGPTGGGKVQLTFGTTPYEVDVHQGTQTNIRTGYLRPVARESQTAPLSGTWQWRDDRGWKPYGQSAQAQLHTAQAAGWPSAVLHTMTPKGPAAYQVEFSTLRQVNLKTGFVRSIRRGAVAGSGGVAGAAPGAVAIPSSAAAAAAAAAAGGGGGVGGGGGSGGGAVFAAATATAPVTLFISNFQQHNGSHSYAALTKWKVLDAALGEYDPSTECAITCEELGTKADTGEDVVMLSCSTAQIPCIFRRSTAERSLAATNGQCPTCKFKYVLTGPQPSGRMVAVRGGCGPCAGTLADDGVSPCLSTIVITYEFHGGTQGPQHPSPGQPFSGTRRQAYLPDNGKGRETLGLLRRAFELGLLFQVGKSVTTGVDNTTVWGGIHQKTALSGGAARHGWPDNDYFDRVKNECASRGVFYA